MKLMTVSGILALMAWLAPQHPAPMEASATAPADAVVTGAGEVVSVSVPEALTLRFSAQREGAPVHFDLPLGAALPEGAQLVDVKLGAFGPAGLAAALAIEVGEETEYRWLFTTGDPLRGELLTGSLEESLTASRGTGPDAPWSLSSALFASTGERYRLVDIHNPGGDSLELTFRRGALQGVHLGARAKAAGLALDERVVHDVCPVAGGGIPGASTHVLVERVVPAP